LSNGHRAFVVVNRYLCIEFQFDRVKPAGT